MKKNDLANIEDDNIVIVRGWALKACGGDSCAAALINELIFHHKGAIWRQNTNKTINEVNKEDPDHPHQDTNIVFPRRIREWEADLMWMYSPKMISRGLSRLESLGFVTITKNPNKQVWSDRTRWYQFHPEVAKTWEDKFNADKDKIHDVRPHIETETNGIESPPSTPDDDPYRIGKIAPSKAQNSALTSGDLEPCQASDSSPLLRSVLSVPEENTHIQSLTPNAVPDDEPDEDLVCDFGMETEPEVINSPNGTLSTDPKPADPMALSFNQDGRKDLAIRCLTMLDDVRATIFCEPSTYAKSKKIDLDFAEVVYEHGELVFKGMCNYFKKARGTKILDREGGLKEEIARSVLTPSHIAMKFEEYRVAAEAWEQKAHMPRQRRTMPVL